MSSRKRRRSGTSSRWLFALLGLGLVFVILILLAPMLVMSWVRGYLQQDGFRGKMEQFFGTQLQGSVTLAPLRWTGDEVTTQDATVTIRDGLGNVVATDMGGTSYDIGIVVEGGIKHYDFNPVIDRWLVSVPMVHLVTLGAGGGSIASYDRMYDTVKCGPQSAGSDPGPSVPLAKT